MKNVILALKLIRAGLIFVDNIRYVLAISANYVQTYL